MESAKTDIASLGKNPISADQPTGMDVRYEPDFEELQAEIDKLASPSAAGGTDWDKVSRLSIEILETKSKDILVASYLAVAQIHTNQMEGFCAGLRLYRNLLQHFWDNLFPAKKRMRGRVAAINWWLEKSDAVLQLLQVNPLPAEKIEECRQDIKDIDGLLQEFLEDAPLLRPLERFLDGIPVKTEKNTKTEAQPQQEARPEARPAPKPKQEETARPEGIESSSDADKALRSALQTMRRAADYFQNEDLSMPQGYRWRRIAGWSLIQALPPAENGRTQIPPPVQYDAILGNLNELKNKENWEALLRMAEERFQGALLWLDLNRFAAEALAGLGAKYQDAHEALCLETAYLAHRIPGIENLLFLDGTPFSDAETQQWLKSIRFGKESATTEPVIVDNAEKGDHMAETIREAMALAKKNKLEEAVLILQKKLHSSFSKREQLLWRLELSRILMNSVKSHLVLPQLESVLKDIEAYKLEEWDPDLALKGLKIVWNGFSVLSDKSAKDQAADILNRIAKIAPTQALLFTLS